MSNNHSLQKFKLSERAVSMHIKGLYHFNKREDVKERFPSLESEFTGFGMDGELQCKSSPSGINYQGTCVASKFLCANGITIFKLREETVNLLGKSDMYCFSPEHPALTELVQRTSNWALDEKITLGFVLKRILNGRKGWILKKHHGGP